MLLIGSNASSIEGIEDQAADFVLVRIDERLLYDFGERKIGEFALGRHAFALRARGDAAN